MQNNNIIDSDHIPAPALVDMEDPGIVTSVNNLMILSKTREGLEKGLNLLIHLFDRGK